ncbi:hypothetical protein NDU88_002566 [Pleurodeles waltl]|uniref:Uncharacterized protein n=1 Tax=Pleurodeles waltl TaxID=8319 RepID=A0AAV7KZB2_PLEWA|nr:hypothetical protein NDU88_002566 [Pleurodeles waltl]
MLQRSSKGFQTIAGRIESLALSRSLPACLISKRAPGEMSECGRASIEDAQLGKAVRVRASSRRPKPAESLQPPEKKSLSRANDPTHSRSHSTE